MPERVMPTVVPESCAPYRAHDFAFNTRAFEGLCSHPKCERVPIVQERHRGALYAHCWGHAWDKEKARPHRRLIKLEITGHTIPVATGMMEGIARRHTYAYWVTDVDEDGFWMELGWPKDPDDDDG